MPERDDIPDDYHMKVTRIEWDPTAYPLHGVDYVFSMLLETPDMFYVVPSEQFAYIYIIGRGMICFKHDFSKLDEEQIKRLVYYIRRDFTIYGS